MKICVIVRTRNEEENIERFCRGYQWTDEILVADGGSRDRTKELALEFPNVIVRDYDVFIEMDNGIVRTPHGAHLNFLIDWAFIDRKADWVIQDDCDCFPNKFLKENGRTILESTTSKFVYVTRMYLWKNEGHFPKLAKSGGDEYTPGIWAWRKDAQLRFRSDLVSKIESHQELSFIPPDNEVMKLMPPYALLHCPWQSEEMTERKLAFYRLSGQIRNMQHPLHFGGPLEPLPDWCVE